MDNLADSWRTNSYARWDRIVTMPEDSVNGAASRKMKTSRTG